MMAMAMAWFFVGLLQLQCGFCGFFAAWWLWPWHGGCGHGMAVVVAVAWFWWQLWPWHGGCCGSSVVWWWLWLQCGLVVVQPTCSGCRVVVAATVWWPWHGLVVVVATAWLWLWPQHGCGCGHGVVVVVATVWWWLQPQNGGCHVVWFGGGCGHGVVVAVSCCCGHGVVFGIVEVAVFLAMGLFCFCCIGLIVVVFAVSSMLFCSCFCGIVDVNAMALFLWHFPPSLACFATLSHFCCCY